MRERTQYIDIAKGISIICIVLLHFEDGLFPQQLNTFIGSFMISMFYIVAGWIDALHHEQRTLKELIKKRWRQLGIPYILWTIIILVFDCILWTLDYYDNYFIGREVYKTLTLRGIGTLWFLPALFGGEILWYIIRKKKSISIILITLALILVYQHFYYNIFDGRTDSSSKIIEAPFRTVSNVLSAWIGIATGYGFCRMRLSYPVLFNNKNKQICFGLLLCLIAYYTANYWPILFLWGLLAPLLGPIGIILIIMAVEKWSILAYFDYWGRHSLILMVTHYSIIQVICEIINKTIYNEPHLAGYRALYFFIVTMIVEYFIAELIHRRMPFLLGKH